MLKQPFLRWVEEEIRPLILTPTLQIPDFFLSEIKYTVVVLPALNTN